MICNSKQTIVWYNVILCFMYSGRRRGKQRGAARSPRGGGRGGTALALSDKGGWVLPVSVKRTSLSYEPLPINPEASTALHSLRVPGYGTIGGRGDIATITNSLDLSQYYMCLVSLDNAFARVVIDMASIVQIKSWIFLTAALTHRCIRRGGWGPSLMGI